MSDSARLDAAAAAVARGDLTAAAYDHLVRWLTEPAFADFAADTAALVDSGDWAAAQDCFGDVIPFGTAGRRGREGVGPNRINARTMAESAAGLADWYTRAGGPVSCVVAYDTRRHSAEYGRLCAEVLAARGLTVELFDGYRATPQLAFAVLDRGADCGIMITASHNPPDDNGFKAYGRHGGQVVPPDDEGIIACVKALAGEPIERLPLDRAVAAGRLRLLGDAQDARYTAYVAGQACGTAREVMLVYSPLQGTGARCVMPVLERAGFTDVRLVPAQAKPSSEFDAVPGGLANPESPPAMDAVMALCAELDADAGIASDPDADRIGYVARDAETPGGYRFFTGQQLGVLVAWWQCSARRAGGTMPARPVILKSAVTTELIARLAEDAGARVIGDLPVGFRWVGETVEVSLPAAGETMILALEESHGVNCGSRVRDKDAASAALALAELTAALRAEGLTAGEQLDRLYRRHGYHAEALHSEAKPVRAEIDALLAALRERPPAEVDGLRVIQVQDRARGDWVNPNTGRPVLENFLIYELAGDARVDGATLAIRPSGTEPKMKVYATARRAVPPDGDLAAVKAVVDPLVRALPARLLAAVRTD